MKTILELRRALKPLALPEPRIPIKIHADGTCQAIVFGRNTLFNNGGTDYLLSCWECFRVASHQEAEAIGPYDFTM